MGGNNAIEPRYRLRSIQTLPTIDSLAVWTADCKCFSYRNHCRREGLRPVSRRNGLPKKRLKASAGIERSRRRRRSPVNGRAGSNRISSGFRSRGPNPFRRPACLPRGKPRASADKEHSQQRRVLTPVGIRAPSRRQRSDASGSSLNDQRTQALFGQGFSAAIARLDTLRPTDTIPIRMGKIQQSR